MTIKQCIRKKGWGREVNALKQFQSIKISFINGGKCDETEFDISCACTHEGEEELSSLYKVFCRECGITNNTVTAIRVTQSANRYEELL